MSTEKCFCHIVKDGEIYVIKDREAREKIDSLTSDLEETKKLIKLNTEEGVLQLFYDYEQRILDVESSTTTIESNFVQHVLNTNERVGNCETNVETALSNLSLSLETFQSALTELSEDTESRFESIEEQLENTGVIYKHEMLAGSTGTLSFSDIPAGIYEVSLYRSPESLSKGFDIYNGSKTSANKIVEFMGEAKFIANVAVEDGKNTFTLLSPLTGFYYSSSTSSSPVFKTFPSVVDKESSLALLIANTHANYLYVTAIFRKIS